MFEKLKQEILKEKIKKIKLIETLPIYDYEFYGDIKVYLKGELLPKYNMNLNYKTDIYLPLETIYSFVNTQDIEEINYTMKIILQKSFYIKPIITKKMRLHFLDDNEIIRRFYKYKKLFIALENDLIKLQNKFGGGKKYFDISKDSKIDDCECNHYVEFNQKQEYSLKISKHIKGTFLMKKLEKIYGDNFFLNSYFIYSEIVLEEKNHINSLSFNMPYYVIKYLL